MLWWNLREGASACHTHDVAGRGRWGRGRWRGHTPRGPSPGRSAVIRRDTPPLGRCEEDGRRAPVSHARAQDRAHCAGRHSLRARIAPPHCTTPSPSPPPSPAAGANSPTNTFLVWLVSKLLQPTRVAEKASHRMRILRPRPGLASHAHSPTPSSAESTCSAKGSAKPNL